jgi:hypothetical protein
VGAEAARRETSMSIHVKYPAHGTCSASCARLLPRPFFLTFDETNAAAEITAARVGVVTYSWAERYVQNRKCKDNLSLGKRIGALTA